VIKRNGDRESFDRSKLLKGLVIACEKTGVAQTQLENIVEEIEAELQQQAVREVFSTDIGELALKHLQSLNEVAYIRFASVHQQFQGIKDFLEILNHLQSTPSNAQTDSSNHYEDWEGDRSPLQNDRETVSSGLSNHQSL
jgi:transcriptional repressor NrdR